MNKRILKFRIWYYDQKKFDYNVEFKDFAQYSFPLYWCEVQQYTGLKDINGLDIYEGDILQRPCSCSDYIFKYICEWSDEETAFMLRNNWDGIMDVFLPDFKSLEVIGNIFENSDFLNK
jgi:uncharacterized phage protein (TIGR01671 family)